MDPVTAAKLMGLAKNYWKEIIIGILCLIGGFLFLPIIVIAMLFPAATPEIIEDYKKTAYEANVNWVEMVIHDMVQNDNNFDDISKDDVLNTCLKFLVLEVKEYENVNHKYYVEVIDKETGEITIKEVDNWKIEFKQNVTVTGENIIKYLDKKRYRNNNNIQKIMNNIDRLNKDKFYEVEIMYKDFKDVIRNFSAEQKEWAYEVYLSNQIQKMYGEYVELPDFIEVKDNNLFTNPVPGLNRITSEFGTRIHPIKNIKEFHRGIDIAGKTGTPIITTAKGKVIQVSYSSGEAGYFVKIEHKNNLGTWYTRYLHMSQINVEVGQELKKGEVIGAVGNTGLSTGSHLHFELYYENQIVNPLDYVDIK